MPYEFLAFAIDDDVARLTLRRPPLNVMHPQMVAEMQDALDRVAKAAAVRVLVVAAEGKVFSAGVSVEDHLPDRVRPMITAFHGLFRALWALPCPTIAVVHGAALGGGCELACACDRVIASDMASFGVPEIKLGSFPPVAAVYFPYRIGLARTLQLITSGDTLTTADAAHIGLVDRVLPPSMLEKAIEDEIGRMKRRSAPALRLARRAVYSGLGKDPLSALAEAERIFLDELMVTKDAEEGLRAFLEKRPPVWSHK